MTPRRPRADIRPPAGPARRVPAGERSDPDRAPRGASASLRPFPFSASRTPRTYDVRLYHASPALRADREVVLVVVRQNGFVLLHASEELQADPELMIVAATRS